MTAPLASTTLWAADAVDGLVVGAVFAVLAMGVVAIHRTTRTLNLAQGGMATLGALLWIALRDHGVAAPIALLTVFAAGALLGAVVGLGVGWPLRRASPATRMVASLGVLLLVQGVVAMTFGQVQRVSPPLVSGGSASVLGVRVGIDGLVVLGVAGLVAAGVHLLFERTAIGMAMRAVAEDAEAASLMGVGVRGITVLAWAVGVALALGGGALLGPTVQVIGPFLLTAVALQALGATLVGGIESLRGAVVGGFLLGELDTQLQVTTPSRQGSGYLAVFVFIVAVLALRRRAWPEAMRP